MENDWYVPSGALGRAVLRRGWILALAAVACATLSLVVTLLLPPRYDAELFFYTDNSGDGGHISSSDISASRSLVDSCRSVLEFPTFLDAVAKASGVAKFDLTGRAVNETEFLRVTVLAGSPEDAGKLADAVAEIFPKQANGILAGAAIRLVDERAPMLAPPFYGLWAVLGGMMGLLVSAAVVAAQEIRNLRQAKV